MQGADQHSDGVTAYFGVTGHSGRKVRKKTERGGGGEEGERDRDREREGERERADGMNQRSKSCSVRDVGR